MDKSTHSWYRSKNYFFTDMHNGCNSNKLKLMAKATNKTAEKTSNAVTVQRPDEAGRIVVQNMHIRLQPNDRSSKDVGDLVEAVQYAESVYYPNRSYLYDIYTQCMMDAHLSGIIEKRISAVLNKELVFGKNGERIPEMDAVIKSKVHRDILREILMQKMWGVSGMEFIPGEKLAFNKIPRKHLKVDKGIISFDEFGTTGIPYDGVWNLWVLGTYTDMGLLLQCAPYAIWKKGNMADWAQYIEIFGQPVIITKYDAYDNKTRVELDNVMKNAGSSLRLQIPNQANFEMMDGKTSNGNGDLQDKFRNACNNEMSVRILGATETTTSSASSGQAQSKEHGQQQDEIIKTDMMDVLDALNSDQFKTILKSYNLPVDGGSYYYEDVVNVWEQQARLNIVQQVAKTSPVDDDHIYHVSGVPKPKNYDAMKEEMESKKKPSIGDPNNPADPNYQPDDTDPENDDDPADPKNPDDKLKKQKLKEKGMKTPAAFFKNLYNFFLEAR